MHWIWNAVVAVLCLLGTIGNMIFVWWKVSSQNLLLTANLERVTLLVAKLEQGLSQHIVDSAIHRTHDFEERLTGFMHSVEEFSRHNRDEHTAIVDLIRSMTDAKKD